MQIQIHQKAKKVLIAILIHSLIVIVILALRPALFPRHKTLETTPAPDAQAVVDAETAE